MKNARVQMFLLALCLQFAGNCPAGMAQEMHDTSVSQPSEQLEIRGLDGTKQTVTPADLKGMPRKTVTVFNGHSKKQESYGGVLLSDVLAKSDAPLGAKLKGRMYMTGVIAEGTDGYQVLYSVAEVDPAMHSGDVIVADTVDGQPLGKNGAFQLVNSEDKRPARWVRNMDRIVVVPVEAAPGKTK